MSLTTTSAWLHAKEESEHRKGTVVSERYRSRVQYQIVMTSRQCHMSNMMSGLGMPRDRWVAASPGRVKLSLSEYGADLCAAARCGRRPSGGVVSSKRASSSESSSKSRSSCRLVFCDEDACDAKDLYGEAH